MERGGVIRIGTDLAIGAVVLVALKQLGIKQGTVAAAFVSILIHEMLEAPVAARLDQVL